MENCPDCKFKTIEMEFKRTMRAINEDQRRFYHKISFLTLLLALGCLFVVMYLDNPKTIRLCTGYFIVFMVQHLIVQINLIVLNAKSYL